MCNKRVDQPGSCLFLTCHFCANLDQGILKHLHDQPDSKPKPKLLFLFLFLKPKPKPYKLLLFLTCNLCACLDEGILKHLHVSTVPGAKVRAAMPTEATAGVHKHRGMFSALDNG